MAVFKSQSPKSGALFAAVDESLSWAFVILMNPSQFHSSAKRMRNIDFSEEYLINQPMHSSSKFFEPLLPA